MRATLLKVIAVGTFSLILGVSAPIGVQAASLRTDAQACTHVFGNDFDTGCDTATGTDFASADRFFFDISHGVAKATASFGSIGVYGAYTTHLRADQVIRGAPASASARFEDTWTMSGFSGPATISLTFRVAGFYGSGCDLPCALAGADGFVPAAGHVSFGGGSPNPAAPMDGLAGGVFNLSGGGSVPLDGSFTAGPIPVTSGVPFLVTAGLLLLLGPDSSVQSSLPITCGFRTCDYYSSGVIDLGHTAALVGIELRDATGNLIRDFTLETESGATYALAGPGPGPEPGPGTGSAVPGPASLWLLFAGVAAAAGARTRLLTIVAAGGAAPIAGPATALTCSEPTRERKTPTCDFRRASRSVARPASRSLWRPCSWP